MSEYANIITQAQRTAVIPAGVYDGIDYHGEPPLPVAFAHGWRRLDAREEYLLPDGKRIVRWEYAQDVEREAIIDACHSGGLPLWRVSLRAGPYRLNVADYDCGSTFAEAVGGALKQATTENQS